MRKVIEHFQHDDKAFIIESVPPIQYALIHHVPISVSRSRELIARFGCEKRTDFDDGVLTARVKFLHINKNTVHPSVTSFLFFLLLFFFSHTGLVFRIASRMVRAAVPFPPPISKLFKTIRKEEKRKMKLEWDKTDYMFSFRPGQIFFVMYLAIAAP